jgi:hypothetical protein
MQSEINPLNAELNPICHLLALLGAHHILHVSRIRVTSRIAMAKAALNSKRAIFKSKRDVNFM